MLRVIIADDHPIVRKGLEQIMLESFDSIAIDEAASGIDAVSMIERNDYDLALLGISLPEINGLEVVRHIRKRKERLPVLVISTHADEQYAVQAIKAGGNGYVAKGSTPEEVLVAIRRVLNGKRYISPTLAERMLFGLELDGAKAPHTKLSQRELQIACMIGTGKTMKQITEELRLSINTVRTYRVRILRKIGARGTSELIHYAVKHRLIE